MRRSKRLLVVTLLIITGIAAADSTSNAQDPSRSVVAEINDAKTTSPRVRRVAHKLVEQAIQDAIAVVSKKDSCGRFFGETKTAEEVLRKLAPRFRISQLGDSRTGIEMSGHLTYFGCKDKQVGYRLFDEAVINSRGPFLKAKVFATEPHIPDVGSFRPNTREARVLMLLHELAHLLPGEGGHWLIPDDGSAPALSRRNTALVESHCRAQIVSLSQASRTVAGN